MGYVVQSGIYDVPAIGMVHITAKANARSVRARWKGGMIYATVPLNIDYDRLCGILRDMLPRLEQFKPDSLYYIGQTIKMPEFVVKIVAQPFAPNKILLQGQYPNLQILIGDRWDMQAHDTMVTISKFLDRIGQCFAPRVLLPLAKEVSQRVGKQPLMWTISNGHRVLGHCNAQGTIALSHVLAFYPPELREYVICHELAHLSEMNHSSRFHEICNEYCQGREKELMAQLRAFKAPFVK